MTNARATSFSGLRNKAYGMGVGLLLSLISTGAAALNVTAEQRAACTPDAYRLCSSDIRNVSRVITCMKANRANLSPACKAAFQKADGAMAKKR